MKRMWTSSAALGMLLASSCGGHSAGDHSSRDGSGGSAASGAASGGSAASGTGSTGGASAGTSGTSSTPPGLPHDGPPPTCEPSEETLGTDGCFESTDCQGSPCGCQLRCNDLANACLPAGNCTKDDDCEPGQFCMLSDVPGVPSCDFIFNGQVSGYFCSTPSDACRSHADCAHLDDAHYAFCVYSEGFGSWQCGGGP